LRGTLRSPSTTGSEAALPDLVGLFGLAILFLGANRQIFQDTLFDLLQVIMILIEHLAGPEARQYAHPSFYSRED